MATDLPTAAPASPGADTIALERATRRLQAWEARHPEAAVLAMLASLAVRIDSALLRRLRLQLLPRAEPGIEADVWFSGLHESRGRDAAVLDAGVQQLLRARLAGQPADADGRRPLDQAWQITAALHAEAPEALRNEEALTWVSLRGGADLPTRIEALLAPTLAAMANGGDARALEVARWAQRAVPRLPDAARTHPSALALWLAALMRLGMPASRLPDTGEAGLPPVLQWLLPPGQVQAVQRVAVQAFDDALALRALADDAPAADNEITLPRTRPLLVALRADGGDAGAPAGWQRTLAVGAGAVEALTALPADWEAVELHGLSGARWRLQRAADDAAADRPPLDWRRMRVQILDDRQRPVGMGLFVSPWEILTVARLLRHGAAAVDAPKSSATDVPIFVLQVVAQDAAGERITRMARTAATDTRTQLVLLRLSERVDAALLARRSTEVPAQNAAVWTVSPRAADDVRWYGKVNHLPALPFVIPAREVSLAARAQAFRVDMQRPTDDLFSLRGAPVFRGVSCVGVVKDATGTLGEHEPDGALEVVATPAIDRFLAWARRDEADWPGILLHHPVDDPYGKGAEMDERAVQRIEAAARRARVRLLQRDAGQQARSVIDDTDDPAFLPDLAAALRLVTPVTREGSTPAARLRLLALAARQWARPDFGLLTLGFRRDVVNEKVPPGLAAAQRLMLEKLDDESLARALLELAEAAGPTAAPSPGEAAAALQGRLDQLARAFQPTARSIVPLRQALDAGSLAGVAALIVGRWNISSRLDAVPLVEHLAMMALPLPADRDALLRALRDTARGAVVINAMPVQFARLLIARAHQVHAPAPCVAVRAQGWEGAHSVDAIRAQVVQALAAAIDGSADEADTLLRRLDLPLWVLITTRPLPDKDTLLRLELRLPSARFLFLAGDQPDLADAARAIGAEPLPPIEPGSDLRWLQGYKRLMQWARPRKPLTAQPGRRPTKAAARKPARK